MAPPAWAAALFIEAGSPWWGFWTPGLGRSIHRRVGCGRWSHLRALCLFIIIALGESILVTGSSLANVAWSPMVLAAFVLAFLGAVAMWWIYFTIGAERASHVISLSRDPGRLARSAYTYMHVPIVAGIVVAAVADELVLAHPGGDTNGFALPTIVGGPARTCSATRCSSARSRWKCQYRMWLDLAARFIAVVLRTAPPLLLLLATTSYWWAWQHANGCLSLDRGRSHCEWVRHL